MLTKGAAAPGIQHDISHVSCMNCGNQLSLGDCEELNMRSMTSNYSTRSTTPVPCAGGKLGKLVAKVEHSLGSATFMTLSYADWGPHRTMTGGQV